MTITSDLIEVPDDNEDPYTSTPTHVRLYQEGEEWFIDGQDDSYRYTEMCWSYDTFAEAAANLADFVKLSQLSGVTWQWNASRPRRSLRKELRNDLGW